MSLKKGTKIFGTVTFRLTLWYAVLFSFVSLALFGIISLTLTKNLSKRMDDALHNEAGEIENISRTGGLNALMEEFKREAESIGTTRSFFRMITPAGNPVVTSDMSAWKGIRPLKGVPGLSVGEEVIETLIVPGHSHHVRVISKKTEDGNIIQIGNTLYDDEKLIEAYRKVSATAIAILLLCGGFLGWLLARRAMAGVERVTQTATGIGKADLVSRVPMGDEGEEINNLASAFNDMLERIQGVVTELKDVTNNIAHDLRSPLTRIRGIAETTMTGEQDPDAYREMAGIVVEECDRLVGMINVMLDIAMTETGAQAPAKDDIDLSGLVRSAYEIFQAVAEDKDVSLRMDAPEGQVMIRGDRSQIQRMIANILDNAVKFTPGGGTVGIAVEETPGQAVVTISDSGTGIAEQDLPRIFERFYRGDQSRSTPGSGLGLSHVKAIVDAHGGKIHVASSPGHGSVFTITLAREHS